MRFLPNCPVTRPMIMLRPWIRRLVTLSSGIQSQRDALPVFALATIPSWGIEVSSLR
jgi:hypothetical protein